MINLVGYSIVIVFVWISEKSNSIFRKEIKKDEHPALLSHHPAFCPFSDPIFNDMNIQVIYNLTIIVYKMLS